MAEAARRGFRYGHPDWCNLGQGQPETGPLPGAPPRVHQRRDRRDDQEYAPVPGSGSCARPSPSSTTSSTGRACRRSTPRENVCICGGGRASLTRAAAALGHINLGHFLPDYTAYEELLDIFRLLHRDPDPARGERGYRFALEELRARDPRPRALGAAALEPLQPHRQGDRGRRARGWVGARARARLHAADRRVLLALHLARRPTAAADGERGALRGGRGPRSGRDLRRPHQELALSRAGA